LLPSTSVILIGGSYRAGHYNVQPCTKPRPLGEMASNHFTFENELEINYLSVLLNHQKMKVETRNFNNIVETIYGLPLEDKMEIITLLEHNVADSRREEIADNYKKSTIEQKAGKLKFSSKISDLKKIL
jgi:hypothetical protein